MKKLLVLMMALVLVVSMAACGQKEPGKNDMQTIQENGKLVVGITDFAPMDYKDENGEWVGFDADMAKEFAKYLGMDVEFVEIEWKNKVLELNGGNIDCVWNGMTLTDEVKSSMDCSVPYCNNQQIVVVKKDVADKYQSVEACKALSFAVEEGSAGEEMAIENGFDYIPVKDQATAVMEVASGTSDAAIIDSLMAAAMVGEGTGYEQLTYTIGLNNEEYGVGFRKGSELRDKFNQFFAEATESGLVEEIATKYQIQAALIK